MSMLCLAGPGKTVFGLAVCTARRHVRGHSLLAEIRSPANNFVLTSVEGVHVNQRNTVSTHDPALVFVAISERRVRRTTSRDVFHAVLDVPVPLTAWSVRVESPPVRTESKGQTAEESVACLSTRGKI